MEDLKSYTQQLHVELKEGTKWELSSDSDNKQTTTKFTKAAYWE